MALALCYYLIMDKHTIDKYLIALHLKSKTDFRKGYCEKQIAKPVGINKTTPQNILHYRSGKNLIDIQNSSGDNVVLRPQRIDHAEELCKGKIFKVIKFKEASYIPPASRMQFGFLYWYSVINEDQIVEDKTIGIFASDGLSMIWQLPFYERPEDAKKILLQFAKEEIIEMLKEDTLNDQEEVILMTATQPQACPYNPKILIETKSAEFEIETSSKLLMEEIKENKSAAAILNSVTSRRN